MTAIAFIPARGGSKRVRRKNIRLLGGLPLMVWTITAARESECFDKVVVSTENAAVMAVADAWGTEWLWRPQEFATDDSPDIQWVRQALEHYDDCHVFAILRPTSPFRTADTIRRAVRRFEELAGDADSMRAVERVKQHPYKMWRVENAKSSPSLWMTPFIDRVSGPDTQLQPAHSVPTQTLPPVYVQNASLELAWRATVERTGTISGIKVAPFFTEYPEGFDINDEEDFIRAEQLAERFLQPGADRTVPARHD
jgi:N-acylneuraminate cytidylyltransferase